MMILFGYSLEHTPYISLRPSGFDQNTVGQRQDVMCLISVPLDINPNTIELGWLNEDDIITDDSRVTIIESPDDLSNNSSSVIARVLQFNPLYEDDEGTYICFAVINESETFASIQLQNFRGTYVNNVDCSVYSVCIHVTYIYNVSRRDFYNMYA